MKSDCEYYEHAIQRPDQSVSRVGPAETTTTHLVAAQQQTAIQNCPTVSVSRENALISQGIHSRVNVAVEKQSVTQNQMTAPSVALPTQQPHKAGTVHQEARSKTTPGSIPNVASNVSHNALFCQGIHSRINVAVAKQSVAPNRMTAPGVALPTQQQVTAAQIYLEAQETTTTQSRNCPSLLT